MTVNCPHCGKQLKLNDKIRESLRRLGPGRKIKVKCVHCSVPFGMDESSLQMARSGTNGSQSRPEKAVSKSRVKPPAPPNTEWLQDGYYKEKEVVEDIPEALVLMPMTENLDMVTQAIMDFGYRVELAPNPEDAIEKMQFINYAAVFHHSTFEAGSVESGKFHRFIR